MVDEQSAFVVRQLVQRNIAPVVMTIRDGEAVPNVIAWLCAGEQLPRSRYRRSQQVSVRSQFCHPLRIP
ncbi:hypothetical protein [Mycolicibacterium celeriflavum]|uniref:hypothetical protein n=1 Tax=Mycolicibacterium celeriflavum TaxID=1249101 RepID=UPI003CF12B0C